MAKLEDDIRAMAELKAAIAENMQGITELKDAMNELGNPVDWLSRVAEEAEGATTAINDLKEAIESCDNPVRWLETVAEKAEEAYVELKELGELTSKD